MSTFNKMLKIKLQLNSKLPAQKWKQSKNQSTETINLKYYNTCLLTGKVNDIIVVDIDVADNGIEEFNNYIKEFGEPKTIKQHSPSGGMHYFFKYTSSNPDDMYLIECYLKNKAKYRNAGLDIRSNGGYIVLAPSSIDGKNTH